MDAIFDTVCRPSTGACDAAGVWLGAILTLLVLSFLLKDTFLFRIAQSLLVGAAIGFGSAVVLRTVLWDQLLAPLLSDFSANWPLAALPLLLGLLLLTKLAPNWSGSQLGNWGLGYLFGVGAALAIGGAVNSTLSQQLGATVVSLAPGGNAASWVNSLLILIGTIGTLLAFRFAQGGGGPVFAAYDRVARLWGGVGRGFMMIAFGAIFASVLTSRISALVGQLYFLLHDWLGIVR